MKVWPVVFLVFAGILYAGEEPAPAPATPLPAALRPGAAAEFDQEPRNGRLKGRTTYRVLRADEPDRVILVREFATGEVGPLTFRSRIRAVLDTATRRFVSFTYEVAGAGDKPYQALSRLGPDPKHPGKHLHERFRYTEQGERKASRTRMTLTSLWVPHVLEPFAAGLLPPDGEEPGRLDPLDVVKGRVLKTPVEYLHLGEGRMRVGEAEVSCRIFRWKRGDQSASVYYRRSDGMPLKHGPAGLVLRPRRETTEERSK